MAHSTDICFRTGTHHMVKDQEEMVQRIYLLIGTKVKEQEETVQRIYFSVGTHGKGAGGDVSTDLFFS